MRKIAISAAVVVAFLGIGVWVLSREETLNWAAEHVAAKTGGRLQYADLRGSLLRSIDVRELRYEDKFGRIAIDDAHMTWRPIRLLIGQVAVGAMSAKSVRLELAKSDEEKKPPETLRAPMSFAITDVRIGTLSVTNEAGTHEVRDLTAAFSGNRKELHGEVKSLSTQYGKVKGALKIGADAPFPLDGKVELASLEEGVYNATTKLEGSLMNAVANLEARAREATASMKLAVAPYDAQPLTELQFTAKDFDPSAWSKGAPTAALSGEGHIVTDGERRLSGPIVLTNGKPGTVDAKKLPFARFSTALAGVPDDLALNDVRLDLGNAGQFAGAGAVKDGQGEVKLVTRNFNVGGLQTGLHATHLGGQLALQGDTDTQRVKLALGQQGYQVRVAAALHDRVVQIDEAYTRAGKAEVTTRGRVALNARKDFAISGRLANFDPSQFGKYEKAQINSRFEFKGRIEPVIQLAANVNVTDSRLFGLPATATGTMRTQRTDHPEVAMGVQLRVGNTRATAKGTVKDPARMEAMDLALTIAGGSLDELYKIVGVPLPPTPPYKLDGHLVQNGQVWELRKFTGAVGDSDLSGDFLLDRNRAPQFMKADLTSKRLDLADLAGFVGAEKTAPGKVATPQTTRVLPDTPYDLAKLKSADADVRFEGKRVITEKLPIDDMSAHLILRNGVLTLAPLNFGVAGGKLVSDITLDGSKQVIASRADVRVQQLQLGKLLPQLKISKASVGELDGRVKLAAHGNSIAAMLGSASGDTALVVGEGEVSDLILRLSNLDVANTLLVLMRGDKNIPIRCMVADLSWDNGVVQPRTFVFDTRHTTLVGQGKANFKDETLDMRLVAKPKGKSLVSLRGPINVRGTFANPSVMPDIPQLGARTLAAAALGVIAPPLAVLPFVQLGGQSDVQCGPLVQHAQAQIRSPVQPPQQVATAKR
ncbi:MAG TPA: AsmA family protein [Burkholderiales bacterium]|nr:AsmA family protein [Burkholderiales bacterium]